MFAVGWNEILAVRATQLLSIKDSTGQAVSSVFLFAPSLSRLLSPKISYPQKSHMGTHSFLPSLVFLCFPTVDFSSLHTAKVGSCNFTHQSKSNAVCVAFPLNVRIIMKFLSFHISFIKKDHELASSPQTHLPPTMMKRPNTQTQF